MKILAVDFLAFCIIGSLLLCQTYAMPPAQCNPGFADNIPPRIRKVCDTLSTLYELGSVMEHYIDNNVPVLRGNLLLADSPVKRQLDKEHVFLRFGKRR